jgi:excisionase family DNA binding protein
MNDNNMATTGESELLTEEQLAALWGTTPRHVRRLRVEAGLPYIKLGRLVRFDRDDVGSWLEAHKTASAS